MYWSVRHGGANGFGKPEDWAFADPLTGISATIIGNKPTTPFVGVGGCLKDEIVIPKSQVIMRRLVNRDNGSGDIWEWLDEGPSSSQINALKMLANADDATLRYEGSQYRRDIQFRSRDKRAILETLDAFETLNKM